MWYLKLIYNIGLTNLSREDIKTYIQIRKRESIVFEKDMSLEVKTNAFIKRFFDLIFSIILLAILLPVMCLIAMVLKIESGEVFHRSEYIGQYGVKFQRIKFRTMNISPETLKSALLGKESFDSLPKITRFGRFLRKTSLDSTPELLNVVLGSLSLVGPPPILYSYLKFYNEDQKKRLILKPGIELFLELNNSVSTSVEKRIIEYKEYLFDWSLISDIKLFLGDLKLKYTSI